MKNADLILPIRSGSADLKAVGGKGLNLDILSHAGYPVPDGFVITTQAYHRYVAANDLETSIRNRLAGIQPEDAEALQAASDEIRSLFSAAVFPSNMAQALREAYTSLGEPPVAVRSSATAEDLPDMSFAGQQDTFLNVQDEAFLKKAVVKCWSSLWTARAIGYRARNELSHEDVALAVVVQEMVAAEASGVLFTANPLTGLRTETVIDATLGLGEALVSGLVEPDHYVIDTQSNVILEKTLGAKSIVIQGNATGGVETQDINAANRQALPDEAILELAGLGQQIAALYSFPQDIEWAWANGNLSILQARPITSLYPIPAGMGPNPLQVMFSFGSAQGILDPITPLGMDAIQTIFAGGASLFDYKLTHESQRVIRIAGERLWANITPILSRPRWRRLATQFLNFIDPGVVSVLESFQDEPQWNRRSSWPGWGTIRRLLFFFRLILPKILYSLWHPDGRAEDITRDSDAEIQKLRARSTLDNQGKPTLSHRLATFREIYNAFPYAVPNIATSVVAGLAPWVLLIRLSRHLTGSTDLAMMITRGLPHNVTTEMDLALWDTACAIRDNPISLNYIEAHGAEQLGKEFLIGALPAVAQDAVDRFLQRYGVRGLGEIDIGRPRWREDPTQIMQTIKAYLIIKGEDQAPSNIFEHSAAAAADAAHELEEAARRTFGGRLKAKLIRAAARRVRALAGLRESPKLFIIHMMGIIRQGLLEGGQDLVSTGVLEQADDLFFLSLNELENLAVGENRDWRGLAAERRANYNRELRRKQIPRLLLSDGRAFYEGLTAPEGQADTLMGSPVSPGVVAGVVRVVLNPQGAQLEPGEILVCPGTDPAWTPLFLSAGGLVMEVGGMMTHGAIVAREYGIPAVVGVDQATVRLQTGQRIQLDGSSGRILFEGQEEYQGRKRAEPL